MSPELNRTACVFNIVSYNNFIDNGENAFFASSYFIIWKMNYWGKSIAGPYPISGKWGIPTFPIGLPVFNFDWYPAKEPYDIPGIN